MDWIDAAPTPSPPVLRKSRSRPVRRSWRFTRPAARLVQGQTEVRSRSPTSAPRRSSATVSPSSCPATPVVAEEMTAAGATDRHRGPLPARRSARRDEGVHQPKRRVHHQCGADRGGRADRRRGLRAAFSPGFGSAASAPSSATSRSAQDCPIRRPGGAIKARAAPERLVVLASRSHCDAETEAFLARLPVAERRSAGSSLKFCLVAEGLADVYPRFGPTMEWDTAAGDAVLRAAGGSCSTRPAPRSPTERSAQDLRNGSFVAWGDPDAPQRGSANVNHRSTSEVGQ